MVHSPVPSFFLYGEPPREAADHFLHLESLDERSRPNNWNIRRHAHTNLSHVFYISSGGGQMRAETLTADFQAPCAMLIPARVVHAFTFREEAIGSVLTLSESYLQELLQCEPLFAKLFDGPELLGLSQRPAEAQALRTVLEKLSLELSWQALGHRTAVQAYLLSILVTVLRLDHRDEEVAKQAYGLQAQLVARFRQLIEERFHSNQSIEQYARALQVSVANCRFVA